MASKMSNFEWGLYIGVLLMIDFAQFVLDFFIVGVVVNRFIDIGVGMAKPLYLKTRGVSLDRKKIGGMVVTFILELFPVVDALPLWTLDGILDFVLDRADRKISETASV